MKGVSLTKKCFKNICNYHNVFLIQLWYVNKKEEGFKWIMTGMLLGM
jgi:hypothetical protein